MAELRAVRERILVGEPAPDATSADVDPDLLEAFDAAFTGPRVLAFTFPTGTTGAPPG